MKKFSEMTDAEKAEKAARTMGWKISNVEQHLLGEKEITSYWKGRWYMKRITFGESPYEEWNPCHSLDHCAVFEEWMYNQAWEESMDSLLQGKRGEDKLYYNPLLQSYEDLLDVWMMKQERAKNRDGYLSIATASQRLDAFLKVTGGCE